MIPVLTPLRTGSGRYRCFSGAVRLRQPELDRGPLTQLAPDLDSASGLSGKALDHRQAKAGSNPQFLGRKEGFECSRERLLVDAGPGIADRYDDIISRRQPRRRMITGSAILQVDPQRLVNPPVRFDERDVETELWSSH
jgi:hypothetical protein